MANEDDPDGSNEDLLLVNFSSRLSLALDLAGYPAMKAQRFSRLAEEFGVSSAAVRKWLTGEGLPSPSLLVKLAIHLKVSIDHLLGVDDGAPGKPNGGHDQDGQHAPCYRHNGPPVDGFNLSPARFALVGTLSSSHPGILPSSETFFDASRNNFPALGVRQGAGLCVAARCETVLDGQIYLLRSAASGLFVRRAVMQLDGTVRFTDGSIGDGTPGYRREDIDFNPGGFITPPSLHHVLILGRVVNAPGAAIE